jgi:hypothetical protein
MFFSYSTYSVDQNRYYEWYTMVHKRSFVLQCNFTWCLWWKAIYDWNVFVTWKTDILQTNNVDLKIINGLHAGFFLVWILIILVTESEEWRDCVCDFKTKRQTNNVELKIMNGPHTVFCILWILKILVMENEGRLYCVCEFTKVHVTSLVGHKFI